MSKRYLANNESLIKKALYLRLMAQDIAEGMKSGNFRSLYRGQGVEFAGVRDYTRGDDIRTIDWNVTARMGRPYIKIFEEEILKCEDIIVQNVISKTIFKNIWILTCVYVHIVGKFSCIFVRGVESTIYRRI